MRRFLVVGNRATTDPAFPLDDLAGGCGRLDLLLRALNAGLLVSQGIRPDAEVSLLLRGPPLPPIVVRIEGAGLRSLHPDERAIAGLVRKALAEAPRPGDRRELPAGPGIHVARKDLAEIVADTSSAFLELDEQGKEFSADPDHLPTFILGDDRGLAPEQETVLRAAGVPRASLGSVSYHTDHCITIIHHALDRLAHGRPAGRLP